MEWITTSHIIAILSGMLIMSCLIAMLTFFYSKKMSSQLTLTNVKPTTPLRWWAGVLAIALIIGYSTSIVVSFPNDALAALNFHIVALDMLLLPIAAIVMVLIVAPQHITWKRVLANVVPFVILCPLCVVVNTPCYTYTVALLMVGYIIAMMIYIMIVGTRYEHELREEYSSLQGRSTKWLICVIIFMALIICDFALFSFNRNGWDKLIYYALNLIVWNIVFSRIWQTILRRESSRDKEIDMNELAQEEAEEKTRGLLISEDTESFTLRLNELMNAKMIYSQDDLTRDDLAREMGMSHTTFTKLLKVTTGQNFYEYINAIRIDKATEMIKEGKMDVWSIGQAVGYRYRSTFYRAFAAIHNCTPIEFLARQEAK